MNPTPGRSCGSDVGPLIVQLQIVQRQLWRTIYAQAGTVVPATAGGGGSRTQEPSGSDLTDADWLTKACAAARSDLGQRFTDAKAHAAVWEPGPYTRIGTKR